MSIGEPSIREFVGAVLAGLAVVLVILAVVVLIYRSVGSDREARHDEKVRVIEACADKPDPAYCAWSTRNAVSR